MPPLTLRIRIQLVIFAVVTLIFAAAMVFGYIRLPAMFGIGRYQVTVELPRTAGVYPGGNVNYRGAEVGRIKDVRLTETGVAAVLSLTSGTPIPADLDAEVHSQSAVGEQYIALLPRRDSPPLKNGDVIPADRTSVPPDFDSVLDALNTGLNAVPHDDLQTVVDESYIAFGGLGPDLSRLVTGGGRLAAGARENLDSVLTLIDRSPPILNAQNDSGAAVQSWAEHLATLGRQVQDQDAAVADLLRQGPPAVEEARLLIERVRPTVPILAADMVSITQVLLTYQPGLEQLLVLLPQGAAVAQAIVLANRDTRQPYRGAYLSLNLSLNQPPPCTTGFLPAQQQRAAVLEDHPERPPGYLYCRVPQDSPLNVRGLRNLPCVTRPGKRAPTVAMCESDDTYVPLNNGYNWKGDPNATLSGQGVPQLPVAGVEYDPATGAYTGPDGRRYTRDDLAEGAGPPENWQSMLLPGG
ncbi:mammalian cell entry protein [Mycolicibacterium duvalii]|uniref:Mammalian cell entry protein n=1 Tax=Mycolicibacterium duvalii TaxID=39688 RepID=A0A7I7K7D9_9MYCO|nr:MlaD family protein [Mycolicibacterium duvalii]MCV7365950.1 MCE family protein [Mycolicibacterium duvalii]PEG34988.1 mammalian cell entry protein [Mycolicibacterium duvalii]BBX19391.1 mammalian cell entry protein [Mycolicibacterium duvalii]